MTTSITAHGWDAPITGAVSTDKPLDRRLDIFTLVGSGSARPLLVIAMSEVGNIDTVKLVALPVSVLDQIKSLEALPTK